MNFLSFLPLLHLIAAETANENILAGVGIDLHTHSSFSDGTDHPIELVRKAKDAGIKVLGLTDHDQIRYSKEAFDEAKKLDLMIIPGSEISVEWSFSESTSKGLFAKAHLLAYFTRDDPNTELYKMLANLRHQRDNRNLVILEKLNNLYSFTLTIEEVEDQARDNNGKLQVVGRPHIASVMVQKGYVKDITEAFRDYLNDAALQLPKWSLDLEETIHAVDRHLGVAVLAHPLTVNLTDEELDRELGHLIEVKKAPLKGLECYSSRHSSDQAAFYASLAQKYHLLPTGGSDYHGTRKKNVDLNSFGGGSSEWRSRAVEAFYALLDEFGSFSPWASSTPRASLQAGPFTIVTHLVVYVFLGYVFVRVAPLYNMPTQPGWRGVVQKNMRSVGCVNSFMAWFVGCKASDDICSTPDIPLVSPTEKTTLDLESQQPVKVVEEPKRVETNGTPAHAKEPPPVSKKKDWNETLNLALCAFGLCFIYIGWSWLQERMMTQSYDGKKMGSSEFVVLANRLAACLFAYVVITIKGPYPTSAPPVNFAMPSVSNMLSTWCQYEALRYVSFPLQVLSKTSKMLASMVMGIFVNGKTYPLSDYLMALVAMIGLAMFHLSEEKAGSSQTSSIIGIFLLLVYILADAFTPQFQQAVFKKFSIDKYQMMWGMNFFSAIFSFLFLLFEGKLLDCWRFASENRDFISHLLLMSVGSVAGQVCIYYTINRHGAVAFSAIMTFRQLLTILLSIFAFGHHVPMLGVMGLFIVFAVGGFWSIYRK